MYSDDEEEDDSTEEETTHEPLDEESQAEEEEPFDDNSDDSDADFYNQQKYIRELKQTLTRSLSTFQGVDRDLLATSSSNLYATDNPYESTKSYGQLPGLATSASTVASPSGNKNPKKPSKIKRMESNLYDKKKCIIQ
jgi:small-conductance mechanosensitive channel